jgi:hypothetical protein
MSIKRVKEPIGEMGKVTVTVTVTVTPTPSTEHRALPTPSHRGRQCARIGRDQSAKIVKHMLHV